MTYIIHVALYHIWCEDVFLLKYNVYMVMYNLIKFYTGNCKLCVALYKEIVVSIRVGVSLIGDIRVLIDAIDLFL